MNDTQNDDLGDSVLKPGERPTLKTISRMTGLAVATVSRALLDAPDIGSDTKKRVQEVATRIGYRPNRAGVRLRTGKTNVISLVLSTNHDMTNHHAGFLISSIAEGLRNTRLHLNVTPHFPADDPMIPVRYIVETQSADAIILNQTEPKDPRIRYLLEKKFPFATHGRSDWCEKHAYFDFDNKRFGEIAVQKFVQRNRKSILVVAPPKEQNYGQNLMDGVLSEAAKHDVEVSMMEGATNDSPNVDIEVAFAAHLRMNPNVDAILCTSTSAAMTVVAAAEDFGLVLGKDLDVCAKEAAPFLKKFRRPIITVDEDVKAAGRFLAQAVMLQLSDPTKPLMQELETPKF